MARKHLPEQGENALVGKDRLPWRLDPSRRRFRKLRAKGVVKHPFPGVELEREFDSAIVEIDEAAVFAEADILDVDQRRGQARLGRGVPEIGQRAGILGAFRHAGEMQMMRAAELFPGLDQPLMD